MARDAVERLEALLRRSFDGENTQSLIGNLAKVRAEDWDWVPPNGERSIRRIFEHAAIFQEIIPVPESPFVTRVIISPGRVAKGERQPDRKIDNCGQNNSRRADGKGLLPFRLKRTSESPES